MHSIKHYKTVILALFFSPVSLYSQDSAPLTLSGQGNTYTESIIYNPERAKYSTGGNALPSTKKEDCPFCTQLASTNDENPQSLILARYKHTYVKLNSYPYVTGHLLILPLEHQATLTEFSPEARTEFITLLSETITIVNDYFKPEGLNIGINMGKVAGGSVPGHMHLHILPRKTGDIAFLGLIGKTSGIFTDMNKLYEDLKVKFSALKLEPLAPTSGSLNTSVNPPACGTPEDAVTQ
jgi:ATP adenylyltransferase